MKIHRLELRGVGEALADYSLEFCNISEVALYLSERKFVDGDHTFFCVYFTKMGKKTIRAFMTRSDAEAHRFLSFYSKKIEDFFEFNESWREVSVDEKGWIYRTVWDWNINQQSDNWLRLHMKEEAEK